MTLWCNPTSAEIRVLTLFADLFIGVVLFAAAGDLAWWPAWAYMALLVFSSILPLYGPLRFDKGLIEERMALKPDAKRRYKYFVGLVGAFTAAELIVPGLDHRRGWTEPQANWKGIARHVRVIIGIAGLMCSSGRQSSACFPSRLADESWTSHAGTA